MPRQASAVEPQLYNVNRVKIYKRSSDEGEAYSTEEEIFQPTKPNTAMAVPGAALPRSRSRDNYDSKLRVEVPSDLDGRSSDLLSPPGHSSHQIGNEGDIGMVRQ